MTSPSSPAPVPPGKAAPVALADGVSFVARQDQAQRLGQHWVSLVDLPLTLLVGVTGVGKTTTLRALADRVAVRLLPDRRLIADTVVIGTLQVLDGGQPAPVADRVQRLGYTARYRKLFGGGIAHALTRLVIDPTRLQPPLVFDGLRGREEVAFAVDHFPHSRYIVLHAPDEVRVRRLLGRDDRFDQTAVPASADADVVTSLAALPGVGSVFSPDQLNRLAALADNAAAAEVVKSTAIVVAERHNYDPEAARHFLEQRLPPERLLAVDTTAAGPETVAARIAEWL